LLVSSMKWLAEERCGADGEEVRLKAEVARKELADRVEMGVGWRWADGRVKKIKWPSKLSCGEEVARRQVARSCSMNERYADD
jgi:hypothetical protein